MFYGYDDLKREVDSLKWQKADDWKLNNISSLLTKMTAEICELKNTVAQLSSDLEYHKNKD